MNEYLRGITERIPIIGKRRLAVLLQIAYWVMLIPMFVIGLYNYPAADDYSMTRTVHAARVAGGSVLACIGEAIRFGIHYWETWTGCYTSAALTAFNPAAFGEQYYVLVFPITILALTLGCRYLMNAILVKALKADKDIASCLISLTLILMVQCMPQGSARNEGFYWYSGTINYTFMFSMGMIYVGLLIRILYDTQVRAWRIALAAILGFLVGGGNYQTAITVTILAAVLLVYAYILRKIPADRRWRIVIPILCLFLGFAISCMAPGNSIRQASNSGMSPIRTILVSLHYTLSYCVSEWTTWAVLCGLAIAAVLAWQIAPTIDARCANPIIMAAFAYGLVSANIAPPMYAQGNIGAGRLQALFYMQYIMASVLLIVYLARHMWQHLHGKTRAAANAEMSRTAWIAVLGVTAFLLFGSSLDIYVDHHYYTFTSAITDLANGHAAAYRAAWEERRELLYDDTVTEVTVTALPYEPVLLFFSDISTDPGDWANNAMADYYGKDLIVRESISE